MSELVQTQIISISNKKGSLLKKGTFFISIIVNLLKLKMLFHVREIGLKKQKKEIKCYLSRFYGMF